MEDTVSVNTSSAGADADSSIWPPGIRPGLRPAISAVNKRRWPRQSMTGNSGLDFFVGLSVPVLSSAAAILYDSQYGLVNLQGHVLMLGAVALIVLPSLVGHMPWTMLPSFRHLRSNSVAAGSWTSLIFSLAALKLLEAGSHPSGCLPFVGNTISTIMGSHISSSLWMR